MYSYTFLFYLHGLFGGNYTDIDQLKPPKTGKLKFIIMLNLKILDRLNTLVQKKFNFTIIYFSRINLQKK